MGIEQDVVSVIASELGMEPDEIKLSNSLNSDLGADELDFVEIVRGIEKKLSINFPGGDMKDLDSITVGDLVSIAKFCGRTDADKVIVDRRSGPRKQHYNFVYKLLPNILFKDPDFLYGELTAASASEFLHDLWDDLAKQLNCEYIQPDGLGVQVGHPGNYAIAIIQLPKPEKIPEAYYAAIIFSQNRIGYFTCEMRDDNSCLIGTILPDGQRGNEYGQGAVLTAQQFINKVVTL